MSRLPGWMPILLDRISWGCSTSPWFANLADEEKVLETGRTICLDLWPFIKDLPENIGVVRDRLPKDMVAAANLLGQLADDERHYQQLFLKQCLLAGVSQDDLNKHTSSSATIEMCQIMEKICKHSSYIEGIYAIVAAEFAATLFSRSCLPGYEHYFERKSDKYSASLVNDGLAWLRLHAKTHARHAIWMKRMLGDINDNAGDEIPEAAEKVLVALLKLWQCPSEETRQLSSLVDVK
jgi:pyrroloquinoline quinone (PQQ) biosynthesis protein C